jgi:glycosyltransferase involved in cell wall biosynthesis
VTSTDAGGPLEFVAHERSGLVAAPEPEAMAEALDRLWATPPSRLAEMGEEGHACVRDIHWDGVVDALTECLR